MIKCRGIGGEEILEKYKEPVDFIGNNPQKYYEGSAKKCLTGIFI